MDRKIQNILDRCHALLKKGHSLEYCLERFKDHQQEIRHYFEIVENISSLKKVGPSKEFRENSLESIISRADKYERTIAVKTQRNIISSRKLILRPAMIFIVFIILSVFSFAGTLFASQDSLPGETLYPLKRSFEDFRVNVYPESFKGNLHLNLLNNRINEAITLLDSENEIDPSLIEELISEMDRHYRMCRNYDCIGSSEEDDYFNLIDNVKTRYHNRYGMGREDSGQGHNGKNSKGMNGNSMGR